MTKRNLRVRIVRFATAVAVGGSAFQLSGCDPTVRQTLLGGLQTAVTGLSTTLISAGFQSLQDDDTSTTGLTTTGTTTPTTP